MVVWWCGGVVVWETGLRRSCHCSMRWPWCWRRVGLTADACMHAPPPVCWHHRVQESTEPCVSSCDYDRPACGGPACASYHGLVKRVLTPVAATLSAHHHRVLVLYARARSSTCANTINPDTQSVVSEHRSTSTPTRTHHHPPSDRPRTSSRLPGRVFHAERPEHLELQQVDRIHPDQRGGGGGGGGIASAVGQQQARLRLRRNHLGVADT